VPGFGCRTAPAPCTVDAECRDEVRCTLDFCRDATACTHEPQPSLCDAGEICLPAVGCIPEPPTSCETPADCEVGAFCIGEWSCAPEFGCQFVSLRDCDDGDECTIDVCDEDARACVSAPRDADGDGHGDMACGGDDCDDADPSVGPSTAELCDGADQDCDGAVDETFECPLGAGEPCTTSCSSAGTRACGDTCGWGECAPPAEICNGTDDDCDGTPDEGYACVAGSSASCPTGCGSTGARACLADCTYDLCAPPPEVCNGVDDDCDGACDDGFTCCEGATRACSTLGFAAGTAICESGCTGFDTSGCSNCGNGAIDAGEQCDGTSLGGASCASIGMGFGGGTLRCGSTCAYDTSMCTRCGNGSIDAGEQCDGTSLGGASCASIGMGFTGGTLRCTTGCSFDTSMCTSFDPSGTYVTSPAPTYTCAFGLVAFSIGTFTFSDSGSVLVVTGAPCSMTGTSARASRTFDVSCTLPGSCDEIYRLQGSFTTDDQWTGTFSATFVGSCVDCTNQTWSITGNR
jgi:hypothetical protein